MGLSNAASRARNYNQTINRNQGGGDKKAGVPYQVGRSMWSSIFMDNMSLSTIRITRNPNVRLNRPMGSTINVPYWKLP
jgi:hypothetical protein